ncbi:MAG: 2OG-Fe(II) oxygenase [Flavobacteriaceae bacterium]|nr:2OG-Fe(II) oxygenase [Flavobacteriaceae bacterium]
MENPIFEELAFQENPLFERIITSLLDQKYAVVEDFFSPELIHQLRQVLLQKNEENSLKKAAIGNKTNQFIAREIRGDFIQWMDQSKANAVENTFFQRIENFINYLNKTCFMGILHKEFHYALYPKGTFYERHLDTFKNDDRRILSMVLYLNDQHWTIEKNGGELVIYTANGKDISLAPYPGRLVIFESHFLEHEVKPVKSGERLSITGWLKTR